MTYKTQTTKEGIVELLIKITVIPILLIIIPGIVAMIIISPVYLAAILGIDVLVNTLSTFVIIGIFLTILSMIDAC